MSAQTPVANALVTGANGLLGRTVLGRLIESGIEVHAIVRTRPRDARTNVVFHEMDLSRPLDIRQLPERIDTIFHLAQAREFREFPGTAMSVFATNLASTAALLDYAIGAGVENFVYASSGGVYRGPSDTITEESPIQVPSELGYYLSTKLSSEALVGSYSSYFATAVLRYFFIYGAGQERSFLLPRLYDRVQSGEPITLQGRDGMRLNPIHVSDAASATVSAARLDVTTTANVAGPETLSLRQIGAMFADDLGRDILFEQAKGAPTDLVASTVRMRELLWEPSIRLGNAISDVKR